MDPIWTYHDERVDARVDPRLVRVPRTSGDPLITHMGWGDLLITLTGQDPLTIPVPLSPDSPTEEDDREWFSIVSLYAGAASR